MILDPGLKTSNKKLPWTQFTHVALYSKQAVRELDVTKKFHWVNATDFDKMDLLCLILTPDTTKVQYSNFNFTSVHLQCE